MCQVLNIDSIDDKLNEKNKTIQVKNNDIKIEVHETSDCHRSNASKMESASSEWSDIGQNDDEIADETNYVFTQETQKKKQSIIKKDRYIPESPAVKDY